MKRHTILMLVTILITALVSCSYENTATVTIDTGIRQQAQLNLFDRVLAFLSLSQPLQADPVPGPLVGQVINKIYVYITSSDIDTITKEIPLETGRITLEVPAGNQRTFTVVAGYQSVGANIFEKNYGGITTVDLSPGQQVNLNIEIGLLPNDISIGYGCNDNFVLGYYGNINNLYYVMLYYSIDEGETWIFLRKVNKEDFYYEESCNDWEYDFGGNYLGYYKAFGYNKYGQGNEHFYIGNP